MIEERIKKIKKIGEGEKYWLFRAGLKAKYFDSFINQNKIGLAWDRIDEESQIGNRDILLNEVKKLYPNEERPGNIVNKIYNFTYEMKKSDIVIMPDIEKKRVAIGQIFDNNIEIEKVMEQKKLLLFEEINDEEVTEPGIPNKYRRIEWKKIVKKNELTPKLELFLFAPHSISEISGDAQFEINKLMYDCFIEQDKIFLKYRVRTESDILADDLLIFYKLIDYSKKIANILEENEQQIKTKISVSSPGDIIAYGTVTIGLILALGYVFNGGKIEMKIGKDFEFKASGGRTLYDYISQKNKNKENKEKELKEVISKYENEITKEQKDKMKKNLELKIPEILEDDIKD